MKTKLSKFKVLSFCLLISCAWHIAFSFGISLGPRPYSFLFKSPLSPTIVSHKKVTHNTILDFSETKNTFNLITITPFSLQKSVASTTIINTKSLPVWEDELNNTIIKREIPPQSTPLQDMNSLIDKRLDIINSNKETNLTPY